MPRVDPARKGRQDRRLTRTTPAHAMQPETYPPPRPALDVAPHPKQSSYPEPFASLVRGREKRRLGEPFGLTNFGVNLTRLKPGAISSVRHGHSRQDEFVYILEGRPTLVTNAGPTALAPGMCAGFKAGLSDAHQLKNETDDDVWYLEIGDRSAGDEATYPDDDLAVRVVDGAYLFSRKDGSPVEQPR
jgi:uncharacterized cupin superfamily protein